MPIRALFLPAQGLTISKTFFLSFSILKTFQLPAEFLSAVSFRCVGLLYALEDNAPLSEFAPAPLAKADAVTTAETVLEAHQTLAQADAENAERFKAVIHFAEEDVKRLKK